MKELVNIQSKQGYFSNDEMKMLSGALDFKKKSAVEIMTPMEKVFMISVPSSQNNFSPSEDVNSLASPLTDSQISENLNFETVRRISENGHSRIPVFEEDPDHIVGLLLVKELAFLNPEDATPIRTILEYYGRTIKRVYFDIGLDELLKEFRAGHAHMAVVWKVDDAVASGDPVPKNLGIVTLEDVIEEIIQMEIVDETEILDEGQARRSLGLQTLKKKLAKEKAVLAPQQKSAIASFLSGDINEFSENLIAAEPLGKLIDVGTLQDFGAEGEGGDASPGRTIYERGKHSEFFTLVLQGKVQVTSGSDHFVSELGPFTFMALKALTEENYVADFTAVAKDHCQILMIKKSAYHAAIKATEISQYAFIVSVFLLSFC